MNFQLPVLCHHFYFLLAFWHLKSFKMSSWNAFGYNDSCTSISSEEDVSNFTWQEVQRWDMLQDILLLEINNIIMS